MKKEYVRPRIMAIICIGEEFILGSKGVTGDNGIEYGGVDDGTHEPSAKESDSESIWEEEAVFTKNNLWDE